MTDRLGNSNGGARTSLGEILNRSHFFFFLSNEYPITSIFTSDFILFTSSIVLPLDYLILHRKVPLKKYRLFAGYEPKCRLLKVIETTPLKSFIVGTGHSFHR